MRSENTKSVITLIALLLCIVTAVLTINVVRQHNTLVSENNLLTEQINSLQKRLSEMDDVYAGVVSAKVEATERVGEISEEMESIKTHLTSAKKMLGLYKKSEEKAVATYITSKYKNISAKMANDIAVNTLKVSDEEKVPVGLLVAIMDKESSFNPTAVSHSGARGLMQVMPFWAKKFNFVKNNTHLHDVYTGIKAGATVLRYALDESGGDIRKALAIYKGPKYTAYVNHVVRLMGNYEIHRETIMRAVKSVLQNYYTTKDLGIDLS